MPSLLAGKILKASDVNQVLGAPTKYTGSINLASTGIGGTAVNTGIAYAWGPTTYASIAGGILTMLVTGRFEVIVSANFGVNATGTVRLWQTVGSVAGGICSASLPPVANTGTGYPGIGSTGVNIVDLVSGETLTTSLRHDAGVNLLVTHSIYLKPVPTS